MTAYYEPAQGRVVLLKEYIADFRALCATVDLERSGVALPVVQSTPDIQGRGMGWLVGADGALWRVEGLLDETPTVEPVIAGCRTQHPAPRYGFSLPPIWMGRP